MAYIKRTIDEEILKAAKYFACIVLYGPRQIGKSTSINHLFEGKINSVTMDDLEERKSASQNPRIYLEKKGWPLIIDEIQKAPELLDEIKIIIDKEKQIWLKNDEPSKLMYILTGSNRYKLRQGISESLAGRAAILEMNSLSLAEKNGALNHVFYPDIDNLMNIEKTSKLKYKNVNELFEEIFKGGMPEYIALNKPRDLFFNSYIQTYIVEDVKNIINPGNEIAFRKFMNIVALRTGCQVNYTDISNKVGVDVKTITNWLSILQSSNIIHLLQPYMPNVSDRIIKTPKLYFMDTGLCSYLCGWQNAKMLEDGIMSGAFFETFIVSDIIKNLQAHSIDPDRFLYYYRDSSQKEIDLLYVDARGITPIEIKKSTSPSNPTKNFNVLKKYKEPILPGLIIDCVNKILPINENAYSYPAFRIGE